MKQHIALIVGLAFYWPFFRNSYFGYFFAASNGSLYPGMVLMLAMLCCAVLCNRKPTLVENIVCSRKCMLVITGFATVLLFGCAFILMPPFALGISAVAAGLSMSALTLAWGYFCLECPKQVRSYRLFDAALSFFVSFIYTSFNISFPEFIPIIYPLFPLASASVLCLSGYGRLSIIRKLHDVNHRHSDLLAAGVFVVLVSLAAGIYTTGITTYSPYHSNQRFVLSVLASLVFVVAAYATLKHQEINTVIWLGTFVLVFFGLFVALLQGENWIEFGSDVIIIGRMIIWVLFWVLVVTLCEKSDYYPAYLLGTFFLSFKATASLVTDGCSLIPFQQIFGVRLNGMMIVPLLLLIVSAFIFIGMRGITRTVPDRTESIALLLGQDESFDRDKICARVTKEYGLTDRESAVLVLLSQGYTVKKISDTLFLSENTIRTHTKNLYRKLDCHTKQEVIDFINCGGKSPNS